MRDPQGFDSLQRIHELAIRHGTEEQRERLLRLTAGEPPSRAYRGMETILYMAAAMAILFERLFKEVAELREICKALMELNEEKKGKE
jgi:hypothetical protein